MHIIWKYVYIDEPGVLGVQYMYVCMIYACIMYVCIYRRAESTGSTIYVCMHDVCMYVLCMYVCTQFGAPISIRRADRRADRRAGWYRCVQSWKYMCSGHTGEINYNSSVTFRPFINIAGDYHSSPCIHVPNSSHSPDSGFGLPSPSNLTYSHK